MTAPMVLHLQKLSVGSESIETLAQWQRSYAEEQVRQGGGPYVIHVTRMFPRRKQALLDGGSIYWVIKGLMQARNEIVDLRQVTRADGKKACAIVMRPGPIAIVPTPKRPFQGWRYLEASAAPADLTEINGGDGLPPALRNRLVELGAW